MLDINNIEALTQEFESFISDESKDFRDFFESNFELKANMLAVLFSRADSLFAKKIEQSTVDKVKMGVVGFALGFLAGILFHKPASFDEFCKLLKDVVASISSEGLMHMRKSFGVLLGFITEELFCDSANNIVINDKLNMQ